jgi:hypothetical protein
MLDHLHVHLYAFRWTVDYARLERVKVGFAMYDTTGLGRDLPF